jgi:hypothetical protein
MKRLSWAVALLAAAAVPASAQQRPAGGELQVNTYSTGTQWFSGIAVEPDGDFVVVWTDIADHDGDDSGTFGQRFDRGGTRRGAEFQVNTFTTGYQGYYGDVSVATRKRGDFVVSWQSYGQVAGWDVFGRRYADDGLPIGDEFLVNTYTFSDQGGFGPYGNGSVAMAPDGRFVVVWASYDDEYLTYLNVRGQRYDPRGNPLGGEFLVNSSPEGYLEGNPDVATDALGNFVVVWSGNDGNDYGVFGRRFNNDGVPLGDEFQVNTYTTGRQSLFVLLEPSVASAGDGSFVVAWEGDGPGSGPSYDVFARPFEADGTPTSDEFRVNTYTTGDQLFSDVASDEIGNFTVVWHNESPADGSESSIAAQRYRSDGSVRGMEFRVNTYTLDAQQLPAIGSDEVGNVVVTWDGFPAQAPNDITAQRFGGFFPVSLRVDTTRNGVIEPGETVDVRPAWLNLNGASLTGLGGMLANAASPGGALVTIDDGTAVYGGVADGNATTCTDCYEVTVDDPVVRPAFHWDATADELITPDDLGQEKRWRLHVGESFVDAPPTGIFYRFIETLLHNQVTAGCAPGAYCPLLPTARQEMAVFVLIAKEGPSYVPPACTVPPFNDVPPPSPFCPFIQELASRGVVAGCGSGNFCPASPVTRQEMAVFALGTLDPSFVPPACTVPPFLDVPTTSPFCPHIAELQRRGVVAGCGGGNYCPASPVLRQEMAVFITQTFGLTLYGP